MKRIGLIGLVIAVLAVLLFLNNRNDELSERPEFKPQARQQEKPLSLLGVNVAIPYSELQKSLNALAPKEFKDEKLDSWQHQTWAKTKGLPSCSVRGLSVTCKDTWIKTKGPKLDVGYRYAYTVKRTGDIQVRARRDAVRIIVPIEAKGNAGLRGDGAKILALHKKNFDGSLRAFFDLKLDIDENWCPQPSLKVSHKWQSSPRVEIIDNVYVDITDLADQAIEDFKQESLKTIGELIDCDAIRAAVAPAWRNYSFALDAIPGQPMFANISPTGFQMVAPAVQKKALTLSLALLSEIEVAADPLPELEAELPKLIRTDATSQQFILELPVRLEYPQLAGLLNDTLKGKVFTAETEGGTVAVATKGVEVYPSGELIVIGVDIEAETPVSVFDAKGTIYLLGRPVLDVDQAMISIEDFKFARVLDNDLWNALSAVFEGQIRQQAEAALRFDLSEKIAGLEELIETNFEQEAAGQGIKLDIVNPRLQLAGLSNSENALQAIVRFESEINTDITYDVLQP